MTIPILYAGNRRIFCGVVISLLSIVKYTPHPLRVYLLTMELTEQNPTFLPISEEQRAYAERLCQEKNPESRVLLLDVGEQYRATMQGTPNAETGYTPYSFLRLFADRLPIFEDRLIYLDTDTLACADISSLFLEELGDCELGGVRDRYGCHFFGINYLNSGVLLLNLTKIRQTGLFQKALNACARKKLFLPDQTAINRYVRKKRILPRRYNEQRRATDQTVIRHFSMTIKWLPFRTQSVKPWELERVHELLKTHRYDDILNEYGIRKPSLPHQNSKGEQA